MLGTSAEAEVIAESLEVLVEEFHEAVETAFAWSGVAPNGIEHAVVVLAAMYAGIPVSPISTGYAQPTSDPARLRALLDVLRPFAWAPWSHTAAGNKIFGIALRHGGTFYVDEGKPAPGAFAATLRNLREIAPTFYFNVPRGWALLADELERDPALATTFFSRVRVLLNAGASIPEALRRRLAELASRYAGRPVPVVSARGATETAPMATAVWGERPAEPETVGTPVPGVEIKLAPVDDLHELRVRAVTVTPGYWRDPVAAAAAFDEDGYYKTGDAAELLDPADPSRGIVFGGRIGENFKLASGDVGEHRRVAAGADRSGERADRRRAARRRRPRRVERAGVSARRRPTPPPVRSPTRVRSTSGARSRIARSTSRACLPIRSTRRC
jgi:acyl-CoA synthetase (AMP-forming)/AMP-acid ligase II